jgi:hypothetical protein
MKNLLIILLALTACKPGAPPSHPFTGEPTCESACANLRALLCEAGEPSDGVSCVELCEDMVDAGAPYPLRCVTEASSCAMADTCR